MLKLACIDEKEFIACKALSRSGFGFIGKFGKKLGMGNGLGGVILLREAIKDKN